MIHCQKCKTQNPPTQATCSNCGADLLPAEGIGSRLGTFLIITVVFVLLPAIPVYFIFRAETPHPILKWIGYFLIAVAVVMFIFAFFNAIRKTSIHERYAIRARRHIKLDTQQSLADFAKALELAPQTERIPLLKERAAIYKDLGMMQEMESDWDEIINLAPETERVSLLKEHATIHKDLGMKPELESDWDKIIDLAPANERIQLLRERAVLYEKLEIVQKFRSAREEILTKMKLDDRTRIDCKLSGGSIQIPQYLCVYCGCPIEKRSEATITVNTGNDKQSISFKFPLCSECNEGRTREVDSAVKPSNFKQMHAFSDGSVSLNFLNPIYAEAFLSANSKTH
jgi:tetratricopeptide (TPR) repeat protein